MKKFLTEYPNLIKEWHPIKNGDLKPHRITYGSDKKVWWKCNKGDDHEWEASIAHRTYGTGCPFCSRRRVSKTNNIVYMNPKLAKEWHPTKNRNKKPEKFTLGSSEKIWWKCDNGEDHEWEAQISDRSKGGCPFCSGHKVSKTNNLAYMNPELAKEWHSTKNGDKKPEDFTRSSNKKAWWKCDKGEDHEWEAQINSRNRGNGCPFCSGQKVSKTNNLAYMNPELAKEWHPTKNGDKKPRNFTLGSGEKVWWKCGKGKEHEWEATIRGRMRGNGCPKCNTKSSSYPEYAICYFLMKNNIEFKHRFKSKYGEVDVFLPKFNTAIEYNGEYYHRHKRIKDEVKFLNLLKDHKLILINENNLESYKNIDGEDTNFTAIHLNDKHSHKKEFTYIKEIFSLLGIKSKIEISKKEHKKILLMMQNLVKKNSIIYNQVLMEEWDYKKNSGLNPNFFGHGSEEKVWWKCGKGEDHEWEAMINSRSRGNGCPFCAGQKISKTNNLTFLNPELAREWHPTKNGARKPQHCTLNSNKKAWWKCDKGEDHEWEAYVSHRNRGSGCPFCTGQKASKVNNLKLLKPKLAREWHPSKNGDKKPEHYTAGSGKKAWWKCDKGEDHEWEAIISGRNRGGGCPFCTGQKISKTNNLAFLNPELAREWHPEKNGDEKPEHFTSGTSKKAWWKCDKGEDHEWEARIYSRNRGRGCPFCAGRKAKNSCKVY